MNDDPQIQPFTEPTGLDALVSDHLDDDVDLPALIERQQRGPLPRVTKALIGALVVAAAFFAGSFAQQHFGQQASSQPGGFAFAGLRGQGAGAGVGGFPGFPGAQQAGGSAGANALAAAGVTVGTVTLVDGTHVYVTDSTGAITKVNVNGQTAITVSTKATAAQLKAGQRVLVRGQAAADGTVTATSITQGSLPTETAVTTNGAS